jgi:MerR family transcriptional regulator/heat shock protein HspR
MSDLSTPDPASNLGSAVHSCSEPLKRIKIGEVARHFGVSVDLLRLYEREGLVIPLKSAKGTRYFTQRDYPWIATVLRLVREARLNFAGIRRLLALLPCWEIRNCGVNRKHECAVVSGATEPCWINHTCCEPSDCYACDVYRAACQCENLKAFIVTGPA